MTKTTYQKVSEYIASILFEDEEASPPCEFDELQLLIQPYLNERSYDVIPVGRREAFRRVHRLMLKMGIQPISIEEEQ